MATTTTPAAAPEVSRSTKTADIESMFAFINTLDGLYLDAKTILDRYGYAAGNMQELRTAFLELKRNLAVAASHIVNPEAPDIVDGVRERIKCGID